MADQSTKIYVPPKGTRGTRVMDFVFALMKPFAGREVKRYLKADGPEPKLFMGFPVLILTTVGAKSGQERSTVLGGFPDGDNAWLIIASKGGSATHPGWFHNIAANPDKVWVQIGDRTFTVDFRSGAGQERAQS